MTSVYELKYIDTLHSRGKRFNPVWRHLFSKERSAIKFAEEHFGDTITWEYNVFKTLEYNRADGYCYKISNLAIFD